MRGSAAPGEGKSFLTDAAIPMRRCNQTGICSNQTSLAMLPPERDADRSECEPSERAFLWNDHLRRASLARLDWLSRIGPGIVEHSETKVRVRPIHVDARPAVLITRAIIETKPDKVGSFSVPTPLLT